MTPQEIAREAAEAIHALIEREADNQMYPHKSDLAALILSAAAKMVRETGACDAMLKARSELEYTWARLGNRDAQFDKTHAELCAALQSLRALTEQPGKP